MKLARKKKIRLVASLVLAQHLWFTSEHSTITKSRCLQPNFRITLMSTMMSCMLIQNSNHWALPCILWGKLKIEMPTCPKRYPFSATIDGVRNFPLTDDHFCQLLNKLQIMHANGLVHRDMRLTNIILLDEGKTAKFCDFGSVCESKSKQIYNGSRETASQSILFQRCQSGDRKDLYPNF